MGKTTGRAGEVCHSNHAKVDNISYEGETSWGKRRAEDRSLHAISADGSYTFMDYRSQGQTLPFIFVDIKTLPTGGLSLFNLYVVLSRSSGQEMIRLLQNFDGKMFQKGHEPTWQKTTVSKI
ncbi:hypothetical protein DFH07DRAFT_752995 [Mycena maculata]|uniref:Uncharacterized protein n=1 Tax=Mycena maculata TaxID=230809 RepID=A0AAD7IAI1_9AGAR|nr:hypothetical protein DFH07DRAFT_752995 [Mycena maculata]